MPTKAAIVEMKILSRRGMTIRAIAWELGVSRSMVRKYLRGEALSVSKRTGPARQAPYLYRRRAIQLQPLVASGVR